MEIGIIGLSQSGKTTVFNALTRVGAETAAHSATAPRIGVVKVPDPRLESLAQMFHPKKVVPAEVRYEDVAASPKGFGKGEGFSGPLLSYLGKVDALLHVVRAFDDASIPHPEGSVDPERDMGIMDLELSFVDLALLEKRLERLEISFKSAKAAEREAAHREQALLVRIKAQLEKEVPLREQSLAEEEARSIENYQFLTAKPLLTVLNIGEDQLPQAQALEERFQARHRPQQGLAVLPGKLEAELGRLPGPDEAEFRAAMGLKESGLDRAIRLSYQLLGLISFFTTASEELRAWTIRQGTGVQRAAGKIHTDMERGFIRAEVIAFEDLARCGSLAEARKRGLLRLEGKTYQVKDGDVVTILFNV